MDDSTNTFRLARQPRKPGSGWQPRPRAFPLTIGLTGVSFAKRRRLAASTEPIHKAAENGSTKPTEEAPSPACDLVDHAASSAQQAQPQCEGPSDLGGAILVDAISLDVGRSELQVFHPAAGRTQRVFAALALKPGSSRRVQSRSFTLSFKAPPPPPPAQQPAPSPVPAPCSPSLPSAHATPAPSASLPSASLAERSPFMPSLEDYYMLVLEVAAARRQAVAEAYTAAEEVAVDANLGSTKAGEAVPRASALLPSRTPAPSRRPALSPLDWFLRSTPGRAYATPVEGVPERLLFPSSVAPVKDVGLRPGLTACSDEESSMTPIEGVPERMVKRARLLSPASTRRAANAGDCGKPLLVGASPCSLQLGQVGEAVGLESTDPLSARALAVGAGWNSGSGEGVEAACQDDAADGCSDSPCGRLVNSDGGDLPATAADVAAAGLTAQDVADDLTAADVAAGVAAAAAAACAAARTALMRLQAEPEEVPSDGPPKQPVEQVLEPEAAPARELSPTPYGGTPALIKINNVAASVASAVRRAAEAMGGPPSCRVAQPPRGALPPRPPSAHGRAAAAASARPQAAGSSEAVAPTAGQRRMPCESPGQPGFDGLIHRAPPGALIFPSRTPSPMGGYRRPLALQGPEPQLNAGAASGAVMVTPTLEGAAAALAADGVASAATSPFGSTALPGVSGSSEGAQEDARGPHSRSSGSRSYSGVHSRASTVPETDDSGGVGDGGWHAEVVSDGPPDDDLSDDQDAADNGSSGEHDRDPGDASSSDHGTDGDDSDSEGVSDDGTDAGAGDDVANVDNGIGAGAADSGPSGNGVNGLNNSEEGDEDSVTSHGADAGSSDADRSDADDSLSHEEHGGGGGGGADSIMCRGNDDDADDDDDAAMKEVMALPEQPEAAARSRNGDDVRSRDTGKNVPAEQQPTKAAAPNHKASASRRATVGPSSNKRRRAGDRKSLAGAGLAVDDMGIRRSTRSRVRPLEYWRGEHKSYGREHDTLITVKTIKMCTPEPEWPLPTGKQGRAKRKARAMQAAVDA